ncbi:MAG TPA: pseudouridine synthase [Thermoanaerobaculia bacterium]|jgi:pseudouridine synthase|nr:pseudouridine synthase [Thermoanaerobaculia bacterium]
MSAERLQKLLAAAGLCSRREAEEWISDGRVLVNGKPAVLGQKADPAADAIRVDGKPLRRTATTGPRRYVLLCKPKGYVSTTSDPQGRPTVLDLVPPALRRGLKPVGRLDTASEGLILLTDDGDFAQAVSHPSRGVAKEYRVKVWGEPPEKSIERLRRGIVLDRRKTAPAEIERHHSTGRRGEEGNTWYTVVLHEGRSRQIRRMFDAIGHPVSKLSRVAIGPIRDSKLSAGAFRKLTEGEIRKLLKK